MSITNNYQPVCNNPQSARISNAAGYTMCADCPSDSLRGPVWHPTKEFTLHEAIASRGWTSQKETDVQRRTIYDGAGRRLGSFTAQEAWDYIHACAQVSA
jgi:hypothetical protein